MDECKPLLDGGIDSAELLAIRRARGDLTADGLLRFDRDGDGALQRAEVAAAKETHELLAGPGRHRPRHVVGTEPLA